MTVGWYTDLYESAISPWTTFGPLAFVISISSLLQEGAADLGRHRSDSLTNNHACVVLRRADELNEENGKRDEHVMGGDDVTVNLAKSYFMQASLHSSQAGCDVAFESIERMKIRQGHIVLIRNIGEPEHPSSGFRLMEKTGNIGKFGIDAVKGMGQKVKSRMGVADHPHAEAEAEVKYVAALKTEPPNTSVNTFNGLLILPPVRLGGPSIEIPHSSCHT